MVIGSGGSGKTTFSRKLAQLTGLPIIHLDKEHWQPNWVEPDDDWWDGRMVELTTGESWIIDGNYSGSFEVRAARADTIIFLDYPTWFCIYRALLRIVKDYGRVREEMPAGCKEHFDFVFLMWIANYRKRSRHKALELLDSCSATKDVHRFAHPREAERYLDSLKKNKAVL